MSKPVRQIQGEAGTLYVEYDRHVPEYYVWFEDFYIIGQGPSEIEALRDAERMMVKMGELVKLAINSANPLTEEESQLVIGAIPLQAL